MTEPRYNNRQIERMIDELKEHFSSKLDETIQPLTEQVTKTNGTVKWQTKLLYVGIGMCMLLAPWAKWMTDTILKHERAIGDPVTQADLDAAVQKAIDQALQAY